MRQFNPNKSVQATSAGIIITYCDDKKSTMIPYDRQQLQQQQLHGTTHNSTHYQRVAPENFNSVQQFIYRKALYGLAVYEPHEVKKMHPREKFEIIKVQKRAQHIINVFKIDTMNDWLRGFFGKYFHNSAQAKEFMSDKHTSYDEVTNVSFKDLGINKYMIAQKLVEKKVLPMDFFELQPA